MSRSVMNNALAKKFTGIAIFSIALFSVGFLSGWWSGSRWGGAGSEPGQMQELRLGGYDFINPLLECEGAKESLADKELQHFHDRIAAIITQSKNRKWASHISVYFREMNSGLAFDIDGREKFSPASLIKVPLLMAYFKAAETDPQLLKKKLTFNMLDSNSQQTIKPAESIESGKSYLIHDLLFRAIVYSDNNAYFLLFSSIDPKILHKVYLDLGLEVPRVRNRNDYMTVTEYASFFKTLYNASYLNKEMSEKALEYLSEVDFKQGLVAGVPPQTVVAHKFGEMTYGPSAEIKQLHDCGIVYYPNHPYLLCVMSRGDSFEYLDDTIKEVSHAVYEEVDKNYRGK